MRKITPYTMLVLGVLACSFLQPGSAPTPLPIQTPISAQTALPTLAPFSNFEASETVLLEGQFFDYRDSVCEVDNAVNHGVIELQVPWSASNPRSFIVANGTGTFSSCESLDKTYHSIHLLAFIMRLHNVTGGTLEFPMYPSAIIVRSTNGQWPPVAQYDNGVDLWINSSTGYSAIEVFQGEIVDVLLLLLPINGETTIEIKNIGSFTIDAP